MGFFWLTCTFIIELLGYVVRYWVGIWFAQYFLPVYRWLPFALTRQHPLSYAQIGWGFVLLGLLMHLWIVMRWQLSQEQIERIEMRPRRPSKQEQDQVDQAYRLFAHQAIINKALPFAYPKRFRVYQGQGYQVRFLGGVLLIDAALFQAAGSPYLHALLAHAMWYYNGNGLRVRHLQSLFPDASWVILGFPGQFVTWLGWQYYQRSQVYNADAYATKLGQKQALITTLEELFLPLDEPRAHYFYDEPYVELRIDRLYELPY